jgi:hypothetical protein
MKQNKDTQRGYFYTGAYPTAAQFNDVVSGNLGVLDSVSDLPVAGADNLGDEYKIGNTYYKCQLNNGAYEWVATGSVVRSNNYADLQNKPKIGGATLLPFDAENPQKIQDFGGLASNTEEYNDAESVAKTDIVYVATEKGWMKATVEVIMKMINGGLQIPTISGNANKVLAVNGAGNTMLWKVNEVYKASAGSAVGMSLVSMNAFTDFNDVTLLRNGRFIGNYGIMSGVSFNKPSNSPSELSKCESAVCCILDVRNAKNAENTTGLESDESYCVIQDLYIPSLGEHFRRCVRYYNDAVSGMTSAYTDASGWERCSDTCNLRKAEVEIKEGVAELKVMGGEMYFIENNENFTLSIADVLDYGKNTVIVLNKDNGSSIDVDLTLESEEMSETLMIGDSKSITVEANRFCVIELMYNPELDILTVDAKQMKVLN